MKNRDADRYHVKQEQPGRRVATAEQRGATQWEVLLSTPGVGVGLPGDIRGGQDKAELLSRNPAAAAAVQDEVYKS